MKIYAVKFIKYPRIAIMAEHQVFLLQDNLVKNSVRKKGEIPRGLPRNMFRFIETGSRACPGV